ncbi:class I adenylate-forming enzyme family protein [Mycolicibacterium thermoresistibile]
MSITVSNALGWWARTIPDQVAVDFEDDELTYRELDTWADAAAQRLLAHGVAVGDRVAVSADNCLEWVAVAMGAHRVGAIVVPLNQRMKPAELVELVKQAEPTVIYCDADRREALQTVHAQIGGFTLANLAEISELRGVAAEPVPEVLVAADDPTVIVFTSGTTGRPKGVVFTHNTLAAAMFEWSMIHDYPRNGLRPLLVLPMFTAIGIIWNLERVILVGGTLVMESQFDPPRALQLLETKKITNLGAPSIVFERIAAVDGFADAELAQLRNVHVGGSRVEGETLDKWKRRGIIVCQMYGQTEIGGFAMANPPELAEQQPDLCGWGGVFTRARVVDAEGRDCAPGQEGEILLRGPGMTPGYWRNDAATAATIIDGWIHTGDVGRLDADGNLTFVDRKKDLIITGGINVSPKEIEQTIEQIAGVAEVAVIAAADPKFQETPAALVRATPDSGPTSERGKLDPQGIVEFCAERLADYKVPRYVVLVDEPLPRTTTGKIAKVELRKAYHDIVEKYPRLR